MRGVLDKRLIEKIAFDGIDTSNIESLKKPNCENLYKVARDT